MFGLFKSDPIKKLKNERKKIMEKAVEFQRNGDLRTYASLIEEAEDLTAKIEDLEKTSEVKK